MKIGLEFRDEGYKGKDFRNPQNGNPGVGGTQFEFLMLAHYLIKKNSEDIKVIIYHFSDDNIFEEGICCRKVDKLNDIPRMASEDQVDILIFKSLHEADWYDEINNYRLKSIVWAHNFVPYKEIKEISSCPYIKRVVAVGKEQYELLAGEDIFDRSTYISNMFDFKPEMIGKQKKKNHVCYMGSLVPEKGFHILARQWKYIIKKVPDAELYVLGSGNLYNNSLKLGKYGLAVDGYEKKFIKYLTVNGRIMPSVHFLGIVGAEKKDIIRSCKVGVPNPSAVTETFCICAVEMQAQGVVVCSRKKWGLLDTVDDGKTGFLSYSGRKLANNIIKILRDDELVYRMGKNGQSYVLQFSGDNISEQWIQLLKDVDLNIDNRNFPITGNYFDDSKWIRMIVERIKKQKTLPVVSVECFRYYKKILKNKLKLFLKRIIKKV